jgi:hypothetical protein
LNEPNVVLVDHNPTFVADPIHSMRLLSGLIVWSVPLLSAAQFTDPSVIHALPGTVPLQAHDIDGDGDNDLLALADGERFLLWRNLDGVGTFGTEEELLLVTGGVAHHLFVDLNGDNAADLVVVPNDQQELLVAWNQGLGSFAPTTFIGLLPTAIRALRSGDLTGNGWPDIVVSIAENDTTGIAFWPNSSGTFTAPHIHGDLLSGSAASVMVVGDLDGDGAEDVFLITSDLEAVGLMNGNADGTQWDRTTLFYNYDYPYVRPILIDVDGDGDRDLAEANNLSVQWAENRMNESVGNFTIRILEPFTTGGTGAFGELGCGGVGVVYIPSNPALPVRWSNYLSAIFRFAPRADLLDVSRAAVATLADLNGDGKDDLVMSDATSGASWYANILQPATTEVILPELDTLCIFGPEVVLPPAIPSNGQWSGSWVVDNVLYRSNASGTGNYPLSYTLYEPQGCPVGDRAFMRLLSGPTISPVLPTVLCSAQRPIELSASPANVEWVGLPTDGILDPMTYTGNLIVCAYTDVSGSSCVTFFGPLNIWPSIPAGIQEAGPFCINAGPQIILPELDLPGTTWSGDIVSSTNGQAIFDPSQGAGEYVVVLDRYPGQPQQCPNSDTLWITVTDEQPQVSIEPLPVFCADGPLIPLTGGIPQGGEWSGEGVTSNSLDPTLVGPGTHIVTYSFTNSGGCSGSATSEVLLATDASITSQVREFCPTGDPHQFIATPPGGSWSIPLASSGLFDPSTWPSGRYPLVYTYTAPNGCTLVNPIDSLEVFLPTLVQIDAVPTLCNDGAAITLFGSLPGTWSGAVTGSGSTVLFDPSALGVGTWTVVLNATDANGCPGEISLDIVVEACTGITENTSIPNVSLTPNPFGNAAMLTFDLVGRVDILIIDASGRPVQQHQVAASGAMQLPIDLSGEASGIYVIRIQHGGAIQHLRAVKAE